jgi:hypothetical protein
MSSLFSSLFGSPTGRPTPVEQSLTGFPAALTPEQKAQASNLGIVGSIGQGLGKATRSVGGDIQESILNTPELLKQLDAGEQSALTSFSRGFSGQPAPQTPIPAPVGQPPTEGSPLPTEEVGQSNEIVPEKDAKKIIKAKTGQSPDEAIGTLHGAAEEAVGFDIKEGEITSETMKAAQELIADINTQQSLLSQKLNRSGLAELNRNDQITTAVALLAGGLGEAFIGGGSGAGLGAGATIAAGAQDRIEGRNARQDALDLEIGTQLVDLGKTQVEAAKIVDALKISANSENELLEAIKVENGGKPLNETQGKAFKFSNRLWSAERAMMEAFEDPSFDINDAATRTALSPIPLPEFMVGSSQMIDLPFINSFSSDATQKFNMGMRLFVNAKERDESGAAINQSEFVQAKLTYFPQAGDSPSTLKLKKEARIQLLNDRRTGTGLSDKIFELARQKTEEAVRLSEKKDLQQGSLSPSDQKLLDDTNKRLKELGVQ